MSDLKFETVVRCRGGCLGAGQADAGVPAPLLDGLREGPIVAACGQEGVDGLAEWLDVDAVAPGPAPPGVEGVELRCEVRDPVKPGTGRSVRCGRGGAVGRASSRPVATRRRSARRRARSPSGPGRGRRWPTSAGCRRRPRRVAPLDVRGTRRHRSGAGRPRFPVSPSGSGCTAQAGGVVG